MGAVRWYQRLGNGGDATSSRVVLIAAATLPGLSNQGTCPASGMRTTPMYGFSEATASATSRPAIASRSPNMKVVFTESCFHRSPKTNSSFMPWELNVRYISDTQLEALRL